MEKIDPKRVIWYPKGLNLTEKTITKSVTGYNFYLASNNTLVVKKGKKAVACVDLDPDHLHKYNLKDVKYQVKFQTGSRELRINYGLCLPTDI